MIIGLTGNKGHGKTTVGKIIKSLDKSFVEHSFATPIKLASCVLLNVPLFYFDDPEMKEKPIPGWNITPRKLMQNLGTFCRNSIDDDIFLKVMLTKIEAVSQNIVITDVRFDNEAKLILGIGGKIVKVDASARLLLDKKDFQKDLHETEAGISDDLIDYVIYNNLTETELKQAVATIL